MPKRFFDTEIFTKEWFMCLTPAGKSAFFFLLAHCDSSGVWSPNWRLMEMMIGVKYPPDQVLSDLGEQVELLPSGKVWVRGFFEFQYGQVSEDTNSRPLQSVIRIAKKNGVWERVSKGYPKGIHTLKDTDKEKDKEKEKEKDKEKAEIAIQKKTEDPIELIKSISNYSAFEMGKQRAAADGIDFKTESLTWACWIISEGKEMEPGRLAASFLKWMNNAKGRGGRVLNEAGKSEFEKAMETLERNRKLLK